MKPEMNEGLQAKEALRKTRLNQVVIFCVLAVIYRLGDAVYRGTWGLAGMLFVGLVPLGVCLWLNRQGKSNSALLILLVSVTVMISGLAWGNEGLLDTSLLAFPGILILVGVLANPRYFLGFLVYMLAFILVLAFGPEFGYHHSLVDPTYGVMVRAADLMVILIVSSFSVWLFTKDLHDALKKSEGEIEQTKRSQEIITHQSQHDALTDLPNRLLARDRITQAIAQAIRHRKRIAILYLDVDDFKSINDSLGHQAGDGFLKQVADRLMNVLRKTDVVSRQGGDEFLIGLTEVEDLEGISIVASNILAQMKIPYRVMDVDIFTSCSIGIAVYPNDGADFDTLLQHADICMYQAKEKGRNSFRFYDEALNAKTSLTLHMTSHLREALLRQEFSLFYQPVMENATGQIIGAEALIRWQHPDRGMVSPADFIPVAERSGLIVEIGEWVIYEACRQMREWLDSGLQPFVLAVNLSMVQFKRGDIVKVVGDALAKTGLNPQYLELELTESTLIQDAETFIETLHRLKSLGVKISIDDFGTGYSNLSYLQRFNVDKLKIDQSFVRDLATNSQSLAIVVAIIQMAKSLNLLTTAEGIEDAGTNQQLVDLKCDQGQGYLFSRPQPASQFEAFVRAHILNVA